MFRAFGHKRSSILDGGLPNWLAHGGNTAPEDKPHTTPAKYEPPALDVDAVRSKCQCSRSQLNECR